MNHKRTNYKRICKNPKCGKEFMGTRTQQYCSIKCRGSAEKRLPMREKRKKACTLNEVAKEAMKNGMSYGKYVAMQYQEERMKR